MTATNRHDAPTDPEPPTPGAALAAPWHPLYPDGCAGCGTTEREYHARGRCVRCYPQAWNRGTIPTGPDHPGPLPAVITPAMLGITRGQIRAGFLTAQAQLWADEARCIVAGAVWQQGHPEQFTAAHLARIFGGDPAPAFWHDDAARAA